MNIISPCLMTRCCVVYAQYLTHTKLSFKIFPCMMQLYGVHGQRGGTQWRSWLGHCATSKEVAGSIPSEVNGISHCLVNKANLVHNFS